MSNQTSYKLPFTGDEIKESLKKVPELEVTTINLNKELQSLKNTVKDTTIPTKLSDLENDMEVVTEKELEDVEAIAKGRATGYVFDTIADMQTWLNDANNTSKLNLGDNLYIRAVDVPDYWWDGNQAQELETQKVELSEYATKEELEHMKNVQGDLLQNDRKAKDFIKNKTHGFSKTLLLTDNDEYSSVPYSFYKNKTNWNCYRDVPQCDLKAGHTYEFKTVNMGSVLCTPTIEEYQNSGCFINAYSEDGKVHLSITGWMITDEEAAEISGAEIGDFLSISGNISYASESLEESFGVAEWDKQFKETGWDVGGCFYAQGALEIYECTPIPLDKKFLPGDVEYTSNKTTTLSESSTDEQYPSAKAVVDFCANKENKSNKLSKVINSVTHASYPSSRAVVDYIKGVNGKWELLEEIKEVHYFFYKTGENWTVFCDQVVPILEFDKTYTLVTDIATVDFNLGNYADFPATWMLNFDIDNGKVSLQIVGAPGYWDNETGDFVYDSCVYDAQISMTYYSDTYEELPMVSGNIPEFVDGYGVILGGSSVGYYEPNVIVDQTYSPTSENAQSGKAVAKAIDESVSVSMENGVFSVGNHNANISTFRTFELIDSAEFTEDVVTVVPNLNGNHYKELYMVFTIPTVNADGSNTDKCRIRCYANNNKQFMLQGAVAVENYAQDWKLFIHAKFIGKYIKGDIFHLLVVNNTGGYCVAPNSSTQSGIVQPGFKMAEDYFNNLTIKIYDANGKQLLRSFPTGTKYELWGVKK